MSVAILRFSAFCSVLALLPSCGGSSGWGSSTGGVDSNPTVNTTGSAVANGGAYTVP